MPTPTAFVRGEFVPLEDATISVMTHAFNYGTAVFEGIRGNWNAEHEQLYLFKVRGERKQRDSGKIPGENHRIDGIPDYLLPSKGLNSESD